MVEAGEVDYKCPTCGKYFGRGQKAQERLVKHYSMMHQNQSEYERQYQDRLSRLRGR